MSYQFEQQKPAWLSTTHVSEPAQPQPTLQRRHFPNPSTSGPDLSKLKMTPGSGPLTIQTKLTIGRPGDHYEQEADRVASQVMSMPEPQGAMQRQEDAADTLQAKSLIQREAMPEEEEQMQAKPIAGSITPLIQREAAPEEEEMQMKPLSNTGAGTIQREGMPEEEEPMQMKPAGAEAGLSTDGLEQQLSNSKGGGSPLPDSTRSFMESRFGNDFSGVRVHTDSSAVQMNQAVQAQAFTHGSDIYYGAGKGPENHELTAHELTHVIQQTGAQQKE